MNAPRREKHGDSAFARVLLARRRAGTVRYHWASLAASILAGIVVGTWLWRGGSGNSLADEVLEHVRGEPEALVATARRQDVTRVLDLAGVRLLDGADPVAYARNCRLRGRLALHLVLTTDHGPVTVLVLRDERVPAPIDFAAADFSGRIVPDGAGSLAVVTALGADVDAAAARMQAALDWQK